MNIFFLLVFKKKKKTLLIIQKSHGQTWPTGQEVRVMVWLGLESWSTRPTGQAVRVMVWLGLESWSDTYTLFPRSHNTLSIIRLGQVRCQADTTHWAGGQSHGLAGLESWSDTTHWSGGQSHGQTGPTWPSFKVMVLIEPNAHFLFGEGGAGFFIEFLSSFLVILSHNC